MSIHLVWRDPRAGPPAPGQRDRSIITMASAPSPPQQLPPGAPPPPDAVTYAVQTGRIRPSEATKWRAKLARDPSAQTTLMSLQPVPPPPGQTSAMAAGQPSPLTTPEAMLRQLWPEHYPSNPSGQQEPLTAHEQRQQAIYDAVYPETREQPPAQAASSIIDPTHDSIEQHSTTSDREIVASLWPEQGRNQ